MGARWLKLPCRIRRPAGSDDKTTDVVSSRGGLAGLGATAEHKRDHVVLFLIAAGHSFSPDGNGCILLRSAT